VKLSRLLILTAMISLACCFNSHTINAETPGTTEFKLNNAASGTEFRIAIPKNDHGDVSKGIDLSITVSSYEDTPVTVTLPDRKQITKDVVAFTPTVFSYQNEDIDFDLEVIFPDSVSKKSVLITSEKPISVFVHSIRNTVSEGFLAIPIALWGKEYRHSGYYDQFSYDNQIQLDHAGGFMIVSNDNGTKLYVTLSGRSDSSDAPVTKSGKKLGQRFAVTLNEGEVYMLKGVGMATGNVDLTSTLITSNKPVGMISFHNRASIPYNSPTGRDFFCEMLTPISTWGKEFVTVELPRFRSKGDMFRVIPSEDSTRLNMKFYDKISGDSLGHVDTLLRVGDFFEINDTNTVVYNNTEESVKGMSVWKSDKPIMLMQYAYSSPWDEDHNWDPVMLQVPPVIQFVQSAVFIAQQSYDVYKTHTLTLFIDKSGFEAGDSFMENVYFDGEPLSSINTIATPVPGTSIEYLRIEVQPGAHRIESTGKIAGYITGAGKFNAYAYPMTTGLNQTTLPDSAKPTTEVESYDCGDYVIDAQEKVTNFQDPSQQYDSGLMKIFLIEDKSNNYELKIFKEEDFPGYGRIIQRMFNLNVLNKTQDAHATVAILDRAGNYSVHEYDYFVEELETSAAELEFGKVTIGETKELELNLTNAGDQPLQIISVHFENSDCFAFKDEIQAWPNIIEPGNSMTFTIVYEPETPSTCFNTVLITTECAEFEVPVSAYAYPVFPDIHFGKVELETKECKSLELINIEADPITIDSVRVSGIFTLPVYQLPEPPFEIPAGEIIEFKSICFTPTDTILYEGEVTIYSNAKFNEELVIKVDGLGEDLSSVYEEDNSNLIFTISPNPATAGKAELLINESIKNNLSINLFDATGNSIMIIADNSFEKSFDIPLINLSSGVYFVRVQIGDKIYSKKLIVKK
jgi:hypothetical protein